MKLSASLSALLFVLPAAAIAGNTLIPPKAAVAVAKSALTVTPDREWNKMGRRPGRNAETWTFDGEQLNDLTFYGGIAAGATLLREVSKKHKPLPRFNATMLITDIPTLVENSYRIGADVSVITIDQIEPTTFAGYQGIRFTYDFTPPSDEVHRKGEGHAAIVDGRLYMITFEAPALHFFDASIAPARAVIASAAFAKK
jgi:hypothetical protein